MAARNAKRGSWRSDAKEDCEQSSEYASMFLVPSPVQLSPTPAPSVHLKTKMAAKIISMISRKNRVLLKV